MGDLTPNLCEGEMGDLTPALDPGSAGTGSQHRRKRGSNVVLRYCIAFRTPWTMPRQKPTPVSSRIFPVSRKISALWHCSSRRFPLAAAGSANSANSTQSRYFVGCFGQMVTVVVGSDGARRN